MSTINLLPAQREFIELPDNLKAGDKDVCIYQGGVGSGKTFVGAFLGILLCLKYPGIIGLVGAYTFTLLRDTTLDMYLKHLDNFKIKYTFNKQESNLYFANGSKIYFRHFDDPECFKSLNVGFIEMEECSQIPQSVFDDLHARLRQEVRPEWGDRFVYRMFGHTNPQGPKGWINEYFVKSPKKNYRRVFAPTTQNTYLPKSFVEGLRELYDDSKYNTFVLGNDDNLITNLIVKNFKPDKQVNNSLDINPRFPIHLTCDFNVDPMCWYICQHYNGNVYILFEVVLENTTTDEAASYVCDLLKKYKNHPIIINGDSTGNSTTTKGADYLYMRNRFTQEGFTNVQVKILPKNPAIEWRLSCFNNMMCGDDGKPHIFLHPQCVKLIYNFENLELKEGTNKPKLPSSRQIQKDSRLKYLGHPIDAVSYLVCLYYPIRDKSAWSDFKEQQGMETDIFGGKYDKRLI